MPDLQTLIDVALNLAMVSTPFVLVAIGVGIWQWTDDRNTKIERAMRRHPAGKGIGR